VLSTNHFKDYNVLEIALSKFSLSSTRNAWSAIIALALLSVAVVAVRAQSSSAAQVGATSGARLQGEANLSNALIIENVNTSDVFSLGRDVVVRGSVTQGVLVFGGDCIVEGRVEGDAASIGGSVIQREGAYIGGDVIVIGGAYHHGKTAPGRNSASTTVMIAGYEEELRDAARNPASLLAPRWSMASLGLRLLSILFWFTASLALSVAAPGAVSRAAARLRLTSVRVGLIGFFSAIVLALGVPTSLKFLPTTLGAFVLIVALMLLLVSYLFGRTAVHIVTGRWLQKRLFAAPGLRSRRSHRSHSESTALLLGAFFWAIVLSLPYVWPVFVAGLFIASLGLSFTTRSYTNWKQPQE